MKEKLESVEIRLLLDGIRQYYGFDLRNYAPASLRRRILNRVREDGLGSISALQDKILHDPGCLDGFIMAVASVNVSAFFRDPGFFRALREKVVPWLRTFPVIRIWHVGCGLGEEVYSMAILFQEEGIYERCRLYATDISALALQRAKEGVFSLKSVQEGTANYVRAGGKRDFSEYYTAKYDNSVFRSDLKPNIVWAQHNLVTDASFNEFHLILCRNVMIYFDQLLQARVHELLYESLIKFGIVGLGTKETITFSPKESCYEDFDGNKKLYKKVR